jgi:uncharacterized glyoxalase superfamily protein PhnB
MSEQTAERVATRPPFGYAGKLAIATNVSDLERAIDWYREMLGCVVYKLAETHEVGGMVKPATFHDPDGNAWMLSQRQADRS